MVLNWIDQAPRRVLALISVACVAMLAFGMYLQHVVGLEPCPMCIVQRYALIGVAVFTGMASARGQKGLKPAQRPKAKPGTQPNTQRINA